MPHTAWRILWGLMDVPVFGSRAKAVVLRNKGYVSKTKHLSSGLRASMPAWSGVHCSRVCQWGVFKICILRRVCSGMCVEERVFRDVLRDVLVCLRVCIQPLVPRCTCYVFVQGCMFCGLCLRTTYLIGTITHVGSSKTTLCMYAGEDKSVKRVEARGWGA